MQSLRPLVVTATLATLLLAGCRITNDKNGKNDNVDISTPFGSMKVKTNDNVDTTSLGLTAYPGAVPVKDNNDKDNSNSADINLSFGDFHIGVKAASFQSPDAQDKIIAFYRKDLSTRYGDVIECKNDVAVGTPTRTSQGLTCDSKNDSHIHADANDNSHGSGGIELRSGSELRQHIVSIETKNGGTHIGLIQLNLPSQLKSHDGKAETE